MLLKPAQIRTFFLLFYFIKSTTTVKKTVLQEIF